MTTQAHPITRIELREELQILRDEMREYYATKTDLAEMKADLNRTLIQVVIGLAGLQLVGLGAVAAILKFLG